MMLRLSRMIRLKHTIWCGLIPLAIDYDKPSDIQTVPSDIPDTGMGRVRYLFRRNEYGTVSPELSTTIQASMTGFMFGAAYGGFIRSRRAYLEFIENNQATAFQNHYEAKKVLQDHVTINFAKGAFAWGWRLAVFTGSFVLVSSCISVYRGKSGILEYAAAGGVSGCLFRTNLGMRGMLVGTILGTALGTVGGGFIFLVLKASGISMDDVRAAQYKYTLYRKEKQIQKFMKHQEQEEHEQMLKQHDQNAGLSSSIGSLDSVHDISIRK